MSRRSPTGPDHGSVKIFWSGAALGGAIIAWGIAGLVTDNGDGITGTRLTPWLVWFFSALVAHDLIIAPLTLLIGRGVRRVRPVLLHTPVQVGLALTAIVTLYIFPYLRGYGRAAQPGNTSVQPLNYTTSWLALLAVIWLAAAALVLWAALHPRRRPTNQRKKTST